MWRASIIKRIAQTASLTVAVVAVVSPLPGRTELSGETIRKRLAHAYDLKTGRYLYTENHKELYRNGEHVTTEVEYAGTTGVLARKRIVYKADKLAPDFRLEDLRSGYVEGSQAVQGGFRMFWRDGTNTAMKEAVVSVPSPAIIDAGFDHFIGQNLRRLESGEALEVSLGVPARLDYYRVRIMRKSVVDVNGRKAMQITLALGNPILRQITDSVLIVYDIRTGDLLSYQGPSNINDESGRSHRVRIEFVL
ncbi:MAG: hypothetical protein HY042_06615 [Spirochaetia bacterium]|nr:hypothetical protein [Spirochaetia bacterium]